VIPLDEEPRIKKIRAAFYDPEYPLDLILVVLWLAAGLLTIYLPFLNETPVRYVLTIPLVLFIPGYCLLAALFPKDSEITRSERIAFSFGISLAVVPLIGFFLNFTLWGIQLDPIVISLGVFSLVTVIIAFFRRAYLPPEERFRVRFSEIRDRIGNELFPAGGSRIERLLSGVLVLVILIALLTTIYVLVIPRGGEPFTEFYVLGENQTASGYPDSVIAGENYPLYVGVKNHENRDVTFMIETWMGHTEFDTMTNTSRISAMDPSDYLSFTLGDNQSAIIPYNLSVQETGYDSVEFLLFNETVPGIDVMGSDRINASYRNLHLVLNSS
jgi:uncharacterized membrane protein